MKNRFKFRIVAKTKIKTLNGNFDHISIFSCNGFIRTKFKTIFRVAGKNRTLYNHEIVAILQCTGLKDKNGKLIFEGDIVKLFDDDLCNVHTVKFGDFAMYDYDFQEDYEKGSTAVYGWYLGGLQYPIPLSISLDTSGMQLEIIGNIYENPELLEGGK